MAKLAYTVKYRRTYDWRDGKWADISNWCHDRCGRVTVNWDYINEHFCFETEEDLVAFKLRWL